jgi:hypothetical protein
MSSSIQVARSAMSVAIGLLDDLGMYSPEFRFCYDDDAYNKHKKFLDFIKPALCMPYEVHLIPNALEATSPKQVLFLLQLRAANILEEFQSAGFFRVYKIVLDDSTGSTGHEGEIIVSHFSQIGKYGPSHTPYSPALKRVCSLISRIMCCDISGIDIFHDYSPAEIRLMSECVNKENFNNSPGRYGAMPRYKIVNNWPEILPARRR